MESNMLNGGSRAFACGLLLALGACGSDISRPDKAFHVVFVSMGQVPATEAAPNLFQFAKTSTAFESIEATPGNPLALSASMLTGLTPAEHGAGGGEAGTSVLAASQTPLPEYLGDHGYITGAVLASDCNMPPESGLNQGFLDYQAIPGNATDVAVLADDWVEHHWRQPFFLFVHLPVGEQANGPERADEALGVLLKGLAARGLLDATLVVVTANRGAGPLLYIKAPGQRTANTDNRPVQLLHIPRLMLRYMALPVAAVRPNSYFTHPLTAPPE
ncbi:MAG: hypothetical protein JKY61_05970 [Planctomycetes bacterium]|nr:hypothetical protein [Planctomycetota bacterium]